MSPKVRASAATPTALAALTALVPAALAAGCSGASDAPRAAAGAEQAAAPAPSTSSPASVAVPAAPAPTAEPVASASASATPAAPPAPSHQGRCPAGMAEVPGGKFKSSYYRADMTVEPFCIDQKLATTDEYTTCIGTGKCDKGAIHACDPATYGVEGRGNLPMICVDFGQAERYCKAQGKRVVSDLEWEWVTRGGDAGHPHPWGADAPSEQLCWSGKEKRTLPCPVASYPPGPYSVFDLVGNVYQWTTTTNDPTSSFRGGRGGSWKDTVAEQVSTKHRGGFKNTYRCGFLGIRCSAPVPP